MGGTDDVVQATLVEANDEEAQSLPLLEAVPISEEHDENLGREKDDSQQEARRVFQVTAPADLPKGYRLTVLAAKTNEEVVVLVPPGGVKRMQLFEGREARPITKRWSDSEFDCSPNYEGSFCWLACCCPIIAWALIMKKLGMNAVGIITQGGTEDGGKKKKTTCAELTPWILGAILVLSPMFLPMPVTIIYFLYLATAARRAVRAKYNIPGSVLEDCCCSWCFGCCTLLQSYRHMKRNGDAPCHECDSHPPVAIQV